MAFFIIPVKIPCVDIRVAFYILFRVSFYTPSSFLSLYFPILLRTRAVYPARDEHASMSVILDKLPATFLRHCCRTNSQNQTHFSFQPLRHLQSHCGVQHPQTRTRAERLCHRLDRWGTGMYTACFHHTRLFFISGSLFIITFTSF